MTELSNETEIRERETTTGHETHCTAGFSDVCDCDRRDSAQRSRDVMGPADGQQKMRLLADFHANATTIPADDRRDSGHSKGRNAEDCPGCEGTNPPYPFVCPGDSRYDSECTGSYRRPACVTVHTEDCAYTDFPADDRRDSECDDCDSDFGPCDPHAREDDHADDRREEYAAAMFRADGRYPMTWEGMRGKERERYLCRADAAIAKADAEIKERDDAAVHIVAEMNATIIRLRDELAARPTRADVLREGADALEARIRDEDTAPMAETWAGMDATYLRHLAATAERGESQ